jgi:hypothetical protein
VSAFGYGSLTARRHANRYSPPVWVRWTLPVLLALAACGTGEDPVARPTPTSSAASPTSAASPVAAQQPVEGDLVLAVASPEKGLVLHRVAEGQRAATPYLTLHGPPDTVVAGVSLSGGTSPTVCAVWLQAGDPDEGALQSELRCYAPGDTAGAQVVTEELPGHRVGVRADGAALAWTESGSNQQLVVADLQGDVVTERFREPYAPGLPAGSGGLPVGLDDLDWLGERTLAVTDVGDSDEGKGLCVVDLDDPRAGERSGFGRCLSPGAKEQQAGFAHFSEAADVAAGEAVTVMRPRNCCGEDAQSPGARAVRIRLTDGAVLEVVAFPRQGRDVGDISGGPRAVAYATAETESGQHRSFSLRWSDEQRGAPISGLPSDATMVVAQP